MPKPIQLTPGGPPIRSIPITDEVPPPASLPPGVTSGRPPLPVGKVVTAPNPARLTEKERTDLKKVGWVPGQPIPANIREQLAAAEQAARADANAGAEMIPVDPSTPPVTLNVQDIASLPPEQQAQTKTAIADVLQTKTGSSAALGARQQAQELVPPPMPKVAEKITSSKRLDLNVGDPDRPATRTVPDPDYRPPAAGNPKANPVKAAAAEADTEAATAADAVRTEDPVAPLVNCPHCHWNLSTPDQPEPSQEEKLGYLQTMVLGDKPFLKEYPLLGGMLTLALRTLTIQETDACFRQVKSEQERGEINSEMDYYERINRYRLYLQIQRLWSKSFDHDQPDGLSAVTNPNATAHWSTTTNEPLKEIETYMLSTVLKNESVCRVAQQTCNRFNRLVARLEALADNSDFWQATAGPS